jgi:polyphosphate kinase 2
LSEPALSEELRKIYKRDHPPSIERREYFQHLLKLQAELIKLQDWVVYTKAKVLVLFEGRDSAGKGGAIKRITQRLNPRVCRVVVLPAPTDREKTQWYFQRYVPHLPAAGEIVLFDRSWYNRAGVERVMGFASADQVEQFFKDVPEFERMLVGSGVKLMKYWFSITDQEQQIALPHANPRSAEAMEALPDRRRPGILSRATTRSGRGSTASTTCSSKFPTSPCRTKRLCCPSASSTRTMSARRCRPSSTYRRSTERATARRPLLQLVGGLVDSGLRADVVLAGRP